MRIDPACLRLKAEMLLFLLLLTLTGLSTAQMKSPSIGFGTAATNDTPVLLAVTNVTVTISFDSYASGGYNFRISYSLFPREVFVPSIGMDIGGEYESTGYIIRKFEQKKTKAAAVHDMSEERDVSELTLQRDGEEPIVLVYGKFTSILEPLARILCPGSVKVQQIRRGRRFVCGDTVYKVTEIKPKQIIVVNLKLGEKRIIRLFEE